jgi:hypothetical protein
MTNTSSPQLSEAQAQRFVVDATPWMSCDECFDRLDEYVECSPTSTLEWLPAMSAHVAGCQACREEVESLLVLLAEDH